MKSKISYKIDNNYDSNAYPHFRISIDGKDTDYFYIVSGFDHSTSHEGIIPLFNCSCGIVGCGGAYINVRHEDNNIIWEELYPEFYDYEDGGNEPEYSIKIDDNHRIKLPLVFEEAEYKQTISDIMNEEVFKEYEQEEYLEDLVRFKLGNFFKG